MALMVDFATKVVALTIWHEIIQNLQKKKTYVLIISEKFPTTHPLAGEPTFFEESIKNGKKIHTIRTNYKFWKKRVGEINKGLAILSVRVWTGKPYNSPQKEVIQFKKLGIQKISKTKTGITIDGIKIDEYRDLQETQIARNDGLSQIDFNNWFKKPVKNGCIIHFTDFKY